MWKDCCCLSSTTAVEGKFGQPKKHWVWFRPGAMGAEHYYPTAGNLAGLTSSCLHPSFSQQEYFEPAPNGSLSSYLRSLQRCAIAAAGLLPDECSGGRNFFHCTLICLPLAMAHPRPARSGSGSQQVGFPSHIHLGFMAVCHVLETEQCLVKGLWMNIAHSLVKAGKERSLAMGTLAFAWAVSVHCYTKQHLAGCTSLILRNKKCGHGYGGAYPVQLAGIETCSLQKTLGSVAW